MGVSAFGVWRLAFGVRRSAFGVRRLRALRPFLKRLKSSRFVLDLS